MVHPRDFAGRKSQAYFTLYYEKNKVEQRMS
jgi:hypothetical protein